MTISRRALIAMLAVSALSPMALAKPPKKLLVVTVTKGFRHGDSIPVAEKILADLGAKSGAFTVDYVRDDAEMAQKMTLESLKNYDGVFFASTTGELPLPDKDGFLKWIASGKAFIGTHAASDTFHEYKPYLEMIGGEFKTHGAQVDVECLVQDMKHPATKGLGKSVTVFDEIYQFQSYDKNTFHELMVLDKHPNTKEPGYYPIAWCKRYGKGRVFYTALGHRPDVWQKPWYQEHVLGGILYALGLAKGNDKLPKH
ncbi:MAG: ThuA domain-containing protein [Armatimonas sp.]